MLAPTFRGLTATLRWRGNLAADAYDVAVKRKTRPWRTVAKRLTSMSYGRKGTSGEGILVRVRPRDVFGSPGAWSSSRSVVYPRL